VCISWTMGCLISMCVCVSSQSAVSYKTYRQTDNATSRCNAFSISGILRILQTSHHKSACVPEQDMPEFPNLFIQMLPGTALNFLQPQNRTHMLRSPWPRSVTFGSTRVCGSVSLPCIAARSAGRHMKQRCSRFAFCCYYDVLL